jgi:hypothetical protein
MPHGLRKTGYLHHGLLSLISGIPSSPTSWEMMVKLLGSNFLCDKELNSSRNAPCATCELLNTYATLLVTMFSQER